MRKTKILQVSLFLLFSLFIFSWRNEGLAIVLAGRVSFSWPEKPGVTGYLVKMKGEDGKLAETETKTNSWTGDLPCGEFQVVVYTLEGKKKKKASPWQKLSTQAVAIPLSIVSPQDTASLKGSNSDLHPVTFVWEPAAGFEWASGANKPVNYEVEIQSEDGKFTGGQKTADSAQTVEVPTATRFKWHVRPSATKCATNALPPVQTYELTGKKLARPEIKVDESRYVTELTWDGPEARFFDIDLKSRSFEVFWDGVDSEKSTTKKHLTIDEHYPSGVYRFKAVSKAPTRIDSDPDVVTFTHEKLRNHQLEAITGWAPFSRVLTSSGSVLNSRVADFTAYSGNAALIYKHYPSGVGAYVEGMSGRKNETFNGAGLTTSQQLKYTRVSGGLSYTADSRFAEWTLKLGASRQNLNFLVTNVKALTQLAPTNSFNTFDIIFEPSVNYFYFTFIGTAYTRLLTSASPQKVTDYKDFGLGLAVERKLNGWLALGLSYKYENIEYKTKDPNPAQNIEYKETAPTSYYGVYLRWYIL